MARRPILPDSSAPYSRHTEPPDPVAPAHNAPGPVSRQSWSGGAIPHCADTPAFVLTGPEPSEIPVLIAVPHAGRAYPAALLDGMRQPASAVLRLEDRLVDRLGEAVAAETGAALLVARAPRALIDLNRASDDIDWEMIAAPPRDHGGGIPRRAPPSRRARNGLGLIPRRLPGIGELWRHPIAAADLDSRMAGIHAPYHAALEGALHGLRKRWGAALLIDLHSMPPLPPSAAGPCPTLVIGDRFGASCGGGLIASAFRWLGRTEHVVAHNRPYAGGYVLMRHAAPDRGIHAFQIEIDRTCYLDSRLAEPGEGFAATVTMLIGLVRELADEVAAAGRPASGVAWSQAAE